jgi:catechol 2,3-dioxygenase-like lactoylglutathione lyase family enzyme
MRLNYAIVFVSDMRRSVSFYRDTMYADPDGLAISVGESRS